MANAAKRARQSAAWRAKERQDRYLEKRIEIAERKGEFAGIPLHTTSTNEGARVWAF